MNTLLLKVVYQGLRRIIVLIVIFNLQTAKGQEWCPAGAVWHHAWTPIPIQNPYQGTVEDRYVGDTTINTKICKKIVGTFTGTTLFGGFGPVTTVPNFRKSFSYMEDSVLYLYNGNGFDTVVNFNAAIGDKWLRNTFNLGSAPCNARRCVTVIDTNRIMINNVSLKRIVTSYSNTVNYFNSTTTATVIDEIIERVMTTNKFLYPRYCEVDNISDTYFYDGELICYEDEKFPLYKREGFSICAFVTSLRELSAHEIGLSLYPNPANDFLNIDIKKTDHYTFQLRDVLGKLVREEKSEGGTLHLATSDLKKGMYFLKISGAQGLTMTEKIIKH